MPSDSANKMTYRFLGDSGLLVSKLGLGGWMLDGPGITASGWYEMMKIAFEHGVNFFDTAESYINGKGEVLMGEAIKEGVADGAWTREDLVISTKICWGSTQFMTGGPNSEGLSRKHLIEGVKASLKRMQLEYVDVIFCHRPEPFTPIDETVRAMNFIINQGWAFYWGTSEWPAEDIIKACDTADRLGLIRPIVEQTQYNMMERSKVEYDYEVLYKKFKLGLTTYSPLAYGLLTGKYTHGAPEGSRFDATPQLKMMFPNYDDIVTKTNQLKEIAEELDTTLPRLALAWCVSNEHVSTVLVGAKNPAQLHENLSALSLVDKVTPHVKERVDKIVQFKPTKAEYNFLCTLRGRFL